MNTTATYSSEPSWSRRSSTETVFSIQGKETDFVQDTSDSEWGSEDGVEYEPVTESDDQNTAADESSNISDNEIIQTRVIEVSVEDDGGMLMADSEMMTSSSDSELDFHDYWLCAHCRATNNNPLYRYCERCFKVRKNLFPPRPKPRSRKKNDKSSPRQPRRRSPDSGVGSALSQDLASQQSLRSHPDALSQRSDGVKSDSELEPSVKRQRLDVEPPVKTLSDPSVSLEGGAPAAPPGEGGAELCIVCCSEPKSGVFVHGRIAHICCCYRCAVKVWSTAKRCPVCNCKVNNVLRAIVM